MLIGIDLGTTNSAMSVFREDGTVDMIENDRGANTTPSVILVEEGSDGDGAHFVVGESAEDQRVLSPERVLARTKQDIHTDEDTTYEIGDEEYTPVKAASIILSHLKEEAENSLGEEVTGAVITVPYYFSSEGRQLTKQAGEAAGFEVKEVINEPTAACLTYIKENNITGNLLVYDLGGGTFDATLVDAGNQLIDVVATEGNGQLGGEDFDDLLYEHVRQEILDNGGTDPNDDINHQASLRSDVKELKEDLSNLQEDFIAYTGEGDNLKITVSREEFEEVIEDKIDQTFTHIDDLFESEAVQDAGIGKDNIDHVLLVGGSTRIPLVREKVKAHFDQEPKLDVNPDTAVARGAAIQAAEHNEDIPPGELPNITIANVLSHNLGVELEQDDIFDEILEKNTRVPTQNTEEDYTNPKDDVNVITVPVWEKALPDQPVSEAEDPEKLGTLELEDLPEVPAGTLDIDVTFEVSHDGTLTVEAIENEETDGKKVEAEISGLGLSGPEREEMVTMIEDSNLQSGLGEADDD